VSTLSTVTFGELPYDVASPGPGDGLPILDDRGQGRAGDEDLAMLGGGAKQRRGTVLPYDSQRSYDGVAEPTNLRTAVVSDDRSTATFLLDLGGRLWSLVVDGQEVLHQSTPLQVGNLALRNAWFAGGAEWNLGFTGHWPLSSAPVFAGIVEGPDGQQVLRMWEYERMLGLVWRVDAVMVDGTLYVHPVLANHTDREALVYWWSNIAVPMSDDSRVIVPAVDAWHWGYTATLSLVGIPTDPDSDGGADATYPARIDGASDHFFRIGAADAGRPWICSVDGAGAGFGHASTAILRGRKLFRWGTGPGGRRWQEWLSPDGGPGYLEVQAGLASTQLEHLPLPAGQTWEWTEAYGAVTVPEAHGAWDAAVASARTSIDQMAANLAAADALLAGVRDTATSVAADGSGWGALEVAAGDLPDDPATPFGRPERDQQPWLRLLRDGSFPDGMVPLPVTGPRWRERLGAATGVVALYLEALAALADDDRDEAVRMLRAAADDGLWQAMRALGHLEPDADTRADMMVAALDRATEDETALPALRLETLAALVAAGRHYDVLSTFEALPADEQTSGRARLALVRSAIALGNVETARRILVDEGLDLPDLREGEDSFENLWASYQNLAGTNDPLPHAYDFRMHP